MILAIECASTDCSVALASRAGDPLVVEGWQSQHRQGHELLPRIQALLEREGVDLADITAFAVGTGPGSFTGLRVGMSVAKGLAYGLGRPIVGVASLDAWLAAEPDAVAAVGRAGARDAYLLPRGGGEITLIDADALAGRWRSEVVAAPGELAEAFGLAGARPPLDAAGAVARAAAERLASDPHGDDLARLEPRYLRLPRGIRAPDASEVMQWP
jgi:tRNA threonylcarbamoyladenosine biosynthesis protein TsaB